MDRSKVREIVEANIGALMKAIGVPHWDLTVDYDMRRSDGRFTTRGECVWNVDYNKANISLDPDGFEAEEDVLHVLRHELFHVALAPFTVFLNAIKPLLRDDQEKADMAESVWTHAQEKAVINLERLWIGTQEYHTMKPARRRRRG